MDGRGENEKSINPLAAVDFRDDLGSPIPKATCTRRWAVGCYQYAGRQPGMGKEEGVGRATGGTPSGAGSRRTAPGADRLDSPCSQKSR